MCVHGNTFNPVATTTEYSQQTFSSVSKDRITGVDTDRHVRWGGGVIPSDRVGILSPYLRHWIYTVSLGAQDGVVKSPEANMKVPGTVIWNPLSQNFVP